MQANFISIDKQQFHFQIFGNGSKYIFAFHGAKQTCDAYAFLDGKLNDYTLVAIDLPHHGQTRFRKHAFTSVIASALFNALLHRFQKSEAHLLAYSIGGRVALSIALTDADKVASLVLVAPDGIKDHAVFNFATRSNIGHRIFRKSMHKPRIIKAIFSGLKRMKIIKPSVAKFYNSTIETPAESRNLYKIWMSMSALSIDLTTMFMLLEQRHINSYLVVGKFDKIIPLKIAKQVQVNYPQLEVIALERGHHLLIKEFVPLFQKIFS